MSESIAVVVGGTSGIGLASARRLADGGHEVHIVGRTAARVHALAESDPQLTGHVADGGDRTAMRALFDELGHVERLVVALSGAEGMGALAELDLDVLRRAFDAKYWAHLTTLQAALPRLSPAASVTLIGAVSAHGAMPGTAGIGSLNAAVEALVRPLAVELAPVRVNAVSPGVVDTNWWSGYPAELREGFFQQVAGTAPVRHVSTASELAEAVVFLAENSNTTGAVLVCDGGMSLVSGQ